MDDRDRVIWLSMLSETATRFNLSVYALCLMPNHFHMLVETPDGNLAAAMHHLNSRYARKFNWRHALTGHLFQGRYHSGIVDEQAQLLELIRYIVLNPVRARLTISADEWPWSSHRQTCDIHQCPPWLNVDWILNHFHGATPVAQIAAYRAFIAAGAAKGKPRPARRKPSCAVRLPDPTPSLAQLEHLHRNRDAAVRAAWALGVYTRDQIARHFAISTRTVTRITADDRR
ncbi:REP element-mobilizing transposase RayT [Massilia umbonata]|uniref:REP element-mobilizing transposase RayT n=1 Tax=Pseudoduganella umbonata TaxID=864828 RepID=A0A7W5HAH1_9BURK|nr:transposase [Pseudoduganella umbonata]MBB3219564.1 REP element-mobilizing transposase RayT [Pseudoduganella umbonata]